MLGGRGRSDARKGGEIGEGRASRYGFSQAPVEMGDSPPWALGKTHFGSFLLSESSVGEAVL